MINDINYEDKTLKCGVCGKWFKPLSDTQFYNLIKKSKSNNRIFYCSSDCKKVFNGSKLCSCPICHKKFWVKKSSIKEINYCSKQCYYKSLKNNKTLKCYNCGKEFVAKNNSKRKYCCLNCQIEYKLKQVDKIIQENNLVSHRVMRNYLLRHNNKCMNKNCHWDWSQPNKPILELHHIDGNSKNTRLSNCILLCPNCHSLTDNYKYKNCHKSDRIRTQYWNNKETKNKEKEIYNKNNNYIDVTLKWNK